MKWPHVERIHPQEKLGGYWPARRRPSSDRELSEAVNAAALTGADRVVLKARYHAHYRPTGPKRLVLPGVPGVVVGTIAARETAWTFVAVSVAQLREYLRARRRRRQAVSYKLTPREVRELEGATAVRDNGHEAEL
jgi:hypothetical protein